MSELKLRLPTPKTNFAATILFKTVFGSMQMRLISLMRLDLIPQVGIFAAVRSTPMCVIVDVSQVVRFSLTVGATNHGGTLTATLNELLRKPDSPFAPTVTFEFSTPRKNLNM